MASCLRRLNQTNYCHLGEPDRRYCDCRLQPRRGLLSHPFAGTRLMAEIQVHYAQYGNIDGESLGYSIESVHNGSCGSTTAPPWSDAVDNLSRACNVVIWSRLVARGLRRETKE